MSEPKTGEAWMQEVRDFADGMAAKEKEAEK